MTDEYDKLKKAARRRRWTEIAQEFKQKARPWIWRLSAGSQLYPDFSSLKRDAVGLGIDWDEYKPLLEQMHNSTKRISMETGIPFNIVATTRAFDFLEPSTPALPVEARTVSGEKRKKYGIPSTLGWLNSTLTLRDFIIGVEETSM